MVLTEESFPTELCMTGAEEVPVKFNGVYTYLRWGRDTDHANQDDLNVAGPIYRYAGDGTTLHLYLYPYGSSNGKLLFAIDHSVNANNPFARMGYENGHTTNDVTWFTYSEMDSLYNVKSEMVLGECQSGTDNNYNNGPIQYTGSSTSTTGSTEYSSTGSTDTTGTTDTGN